MSRLTKSLALEGDIHLHLPFFAKEHFFYSLQVVDVM